MGAIDREHVSRILDHIEILQRRRFEAVTRKEAKRIKRAIREQLRLYRMAAGADTRGDRIASLIGRVVGGALGR